MLADKKALLLVGSPKKIHSTSDAMGTYLTDKLEEKGFETDKLHILSSLKNSESIECLLEGIDRSNILILSFPLYIDALPAHIIKAFELIENRRKNNKVTTKQKMMVIVNCGFPEPFHNNVAIDICKCFANRVGFEWAGALSMGGGGMIQGKPLKELGGRVRYAVQSLDIASEAIAKDNVVPKEAMELMKKPPMPQKLYLFMGSKGWKKQAKKFGCEKDLYATPYKL
ncbi:MAG: hypothetical protein MJA31_16440 [Clostridia bacterium]|nr:hypothetical protein [Clostridia bacterium]